ncbi:HEPN domain-containing protein [Hephaestia caeni]|nr:HEPN domain-containing protein [Hephaestia caeni]
MAEALAAGMPENLARDLEGTYSSAVQNLHAADYSSCLVTSGLFAEHAMRALLLRVTGSLPKEIKNFGQAVEQVKKSGDQSETVTKLVPSILAALIYDVRSKRGAVHVKEVSPRKRDAFLVVNSSSWVMAELLDLFSDLPANKLDDIINSLVRAKKPIVEVIDGIQVVTENLPAYIETLYIIDGNPGGINRRDLGRLVKRTPSSITHALKKLDDERYIHKNGELWHITGKGEGFLAENLTSLGR